MSSIYYMNERCTVHWDLRIVCLGLCLNMVKLCKIWDTNFAYLLFSKNLSWEFWPLLQRVNDIGLFLRARSKHAPWITDRWQTLSGWLVCYTIIICWYYMVLSRERVIRIRLFFALSVCWQNEQVVEYSVPICCKFDAFFAHF